MLFEKKLNLSRFKKNAQGIIDFAILIEQAEPANRDRIIEQASQQDEDFLRRVMKKVVFFEELIYLDETIIAEILSRTSAKVLAHALWKMPDEFRNKVLKQIGHRERRQFADEEERLTQTGNPSLSQGAQKQILKVARQLEAQDKFSFELTNCPRFKLKRPVPVEPHHESSPADPKVAGGGKR
jgi:flagellar motor switch protein FliG